MSIFRPLLAATIENDQQLESLRYPLIASPKVDGIRVLIHPELGPVTRSLKKVSNRHTRQLLHMPMYKFFDGEVTAGPITAADVFNRTTSAVMAESGEDDITYWVFDHFDGAEAPYKNRLYRLSQFAKEDHVKMLPHMPVLNSADVLKAEEFWLSQGFEGIMLRDPEGRYKFNRSTLREQILLKLKRFTDSEAIVVGYEPLQRNQNEARKNALGLTERSDHKAGRVADSTLGNLLVNHGSFGQFSIGSGFDSTLRQEIWNNQGKYLGKTVKFKYQPIGVVDKPRFPIFLGFRGDE